MEFPGLPQMNLFVRPSRFGTVVEKRAVTFFPAGRKSKQSVNVFAMTRRLVQTTESARHPFRRALPPAALVAPRDDDQDWKLFALSFGAFFTCFYTFII
jgi:hypothetical protein